jgi:hypothetical protein
MTTNHEQFYLEFFISSPELAFEISTGRGVLDGFVWL